MGYGYPGYAQQGGGYGWNQGGYGGQPQAGYGMPYQQGGYQQGGYQAPQQGGYGGYGADAGAGGYGGAYGGYQQQPQMAPHAMAAPAAAQWSEEYDPQSQRYYYYNQTTGHTQWEKPAEMM